MPNYCFWSEKFENLTIRVKFPYGFFPLLVDYCQIILCYNISVTTGNLIKVASSNVKNHDLKNHKTKLRIYALIQPVVK